MSSKAVNELESLSDIDDNEVDRYLHKEEEKHYKKIIWEALNKDYLEQQATKEADAVAAKKAFEANFCGRPEELQAAWKLAKAAKANVTKSKGRQTKKGAEVRKLGAAQIAAEATHQMETKKRRNSKINYDVLEKLSDKNRRNSKINYDALEELSDENVVDNSKKSRVEGAEDKSTRDENGGYPYDDDDDADEEEEEEEEDGYYYDSYNEY